MTISTAAPHTTQPPQTTPGIHYVFATGDFVDPTTQYPPSPSKTIQYRSQINAALAFSNIPGNVYGKIFTG